MLIFTVYVHVPGQFVGHDDGFVVVQDVEQVELVGWTLDFRRAAVLCRA
jgi:hypothetical protein